MTQQHSAVAQLFAGKSEMASLMRSLDWSQTLLGDVSEWSPSLKTAVSICLNSRFPMVIWWSKSLVLLYNDAWQPILGTKHPKALGRPGQEVWSEIWDIIGLQLHGVLETAEATWSDDMLLLVDRYGYTEEAYFTYSYSPIFLESGVVGGAFTAVTETTRRVVGERRLSTLRELAAKTVEAKSVQETCRIASTILANNPYDLPFALLYLVEPEGQHARLLEAVRVDAESLASPEHIDLTQVGDSWKLAHIRTTGEAVLVDELTSQFGVLSGGAWDEPSRSAIVLPIAEAGQKQQLAGFLVLGISPRLPFDDEYRGFLDLVASNVTTAIANAQAYEAERKRAEALAEIDRAKTAFFSNVSHEFRTPLTLMLSPLEELAITLDERLQPEEREQLQLVQRNSLRLQKLVNTLLDFSRIEAGRVQAAYEPIDLATYTADLASNFRSLIERAGMQLVIKCPTLPEAVYVDREMWEKIVLNLLSNAFKFTFTGKITVCLHPVGDAVALSVADTGVGIPEAELPRLFERFHRVSSTRSRTYEGSGIGLALVQELVKLHGGTLQVTSQVDQGTTVTIALPFGTAHLPPDRLPPDRLQAARTLAATALGAAPFVEEAWRWLPEEDEGVRKWGNREVEGAWERGSVDESSSSHPLIPPSPHPLIPSLPHILLADDNADMRDYVKRLLSSHFQVETATNGTSALNAIQANPPDLVVTDVMMPEMDGFALLRLLRTNPDTQAIPVILLSARAGEEARLAGLAAGADDYLTKPFSARELLARVEAALKLAQLRREATQQEKALRLEAETAKQQVETILSSIQDGFCVIDRDWRFTYVNDRYCEMVAMPQTELLGQNVWELFPAAVNTDAYEQFQQAITTQTPRQFEYLYAPWQRWYDHRIYPSPSGLTVFLADITDSKAAEAELRQKNAILDVVNESAPTPIFVKDREGRILYANPATLAVLGKSAAEVIGYRDCDLYPNPSDAAAVMANDQRIMAAGQTEVVEESPDGIRTFLGMKAPYRNEAGDVIGLIGIANDITDRVQVERDRERILQQEQAARATAEQANRLKDEFLAVLSHELRSPLNPILGWAKLLQRGKLDETQTAQALATIERNAQLQAELIEDLLDVSRILQGKLSLNVSPIPLASTIKAAIETVQLAAEAKSITIETHFASDVGAVSGDATRLQQIVWNLLSNAVKFTPPGGRVTVQLQQVEGRSRDENPSSHPPSPPLPIHAYAQITISDTGKGIHPAFVPYVFDYFRQEDGATTRQFGGLGLGLAIVRYLVELHGGTVESASPGEGLGATFTVRLPLQGSRSSEMESEERPHSPLPIPNSPLTGLQILVVDDEPDSRDLLAFILKQAGANVMTAATATEAMTIVTNFQPDALLSDVGMPGMDGYMMMRQIRALPAQQGGQVKAIALTAYAGDFHQQQALQAGFQCHLAKPIEPGELVKAIVVLVGNNHD